MAHIRLCFLFALLLGCALGENEVVNDDQYVDVGFEEGGENDPTRCLNVLDENCQNDVLSGLRTFPDETFLLDHCDDMVKHVQCRVDSNKTCPIPEFYVKPLKSYEALESFVVDICNKESSFRKSYLKEVDCINSHREDLERDMRKYFKLLRKFMEHHNLENIHEDKDLLMTVICAQDIFRQLELEMLFQTYCGEGAAALLATMLDRLYDFNSSHCSAHADDVQHYLNLLKEYKDQLDMPLPDSVE